MELQTMREEQSLADKITTRQEEVNTIVKSSFASRFGENISFYICILLPVLVIGAVWMKIAMPTVSLASLGVEAVLTVILLWVGEYCMGQIGKDGGRLDGDYISYKRKYEETAERIKDTNSAMLGIFCVYYASHEYDEHLRKMCQKYKIDYDEYKNTYSKIPPKELKKRIGKVKAAKVAMLNKIGYIDISKDALLEDGKQAGYSRAGISETDDQYIARKQYSKKRIASIIFLAVFSISLSAPMMQAFTFARLLYTFIKLALLLYRMAKGYATGAKASTVVMVAHYKSILRILSEYEQYMAKRLYLAHGNKYGDLSEILSAEELQECKENVCENKETPQVAS